MPMNAEEFRSALLAADEHALRSLIQSEMLDRPPAVFVSDMALYDRVRNHLAREFDTDATHIYLLGSGGMGFSIAPDNFPRAFHSDSDLDFAVVSPRLFDAAWMTLLGWGHVHKPVFPDSDTKWFVARQREMFWGWFSEKNARFTGINRPELLRDLAKIRLRVFETFRSLGKTFPDTELAARDNHARLYRDEAHLIEYHVDGLRRLKQRLTEGDTD